MKKERKYKYDTIEICRNCGGSGMVDRKGLLHVLGGFRPDVCPVCEGSGRVSVTRDVTVTVESYQ